MTFQKDADQIYPGWKDKLGYTGESTVQAATFDWKKKAAAAAFLEACTPSTLRPLRSTGQMLATSQMARPKLVGQRDEST